MRGGQFLKVRRIGLHPLPDHGHSTDRFT
jgi:hypothetical protein